MVYSIMCGSSSLKPRLSVPDFVSQKIRNGKPGFEAMVVVRLCAYWDVA